MASSTVWQCLVALSLFSSAAYGYGYGDGNGNDNGYGDGNGNSYGYGNGQLDPKFYEKSCPALGFIVRVSMIKAVLTERRMGASLLRLFFHDCFVQGCDGSILLDDVPATNFTGEKTAFPNVNSVRGFEVIDDIKRNVEYVCPGVVSCADILALAAREGTVLLGGPSWAVPLGRRDSMTASLDGANSDLPGPTLNLTELIQSFANKSLSPRDLTALSGAHTIGFSQCVFFRDHIYNDTNIDPAFAADLRRSCPAPAGSGDTNLTPLDAQTRFVFDNAYYPNLVARRALLHSDQELFNGAAQDELVRQYSADSALFFADFVAAMIKMGNISPLTGSAGEIRRNCRVVNSS
ncbi:peroxidase P7-like isoform X1 [Triticum dicoccoides]|uniref:peroxidase P7-like isoform X1 n=1 Tax=Triticum dicoccoides TaxID=85692 RepID=UPI001890F192|nr:peroxidase P7-like isoform X1 [Triticum dicoccoides]